MTSRDATDLVNQTREQVLEALRAEGGGASLEALVDAIRRDDPSKTTATVKAAVMSLVATGEVAVTTAGDADLVPA
jgi:Fe2+ or Zn2+ uptake regulation protein